MSTFDVSAYNDLPFIIDADARFETQLASANLTRTQFFSKLAPLFFEADYAGRYAVCLIHRHYSLNDGERMVTTNNSSKPSTETTTTIAGERWASTGEFFVKFNSIVALYGVDILGICYAPGKLAEGLICLESPGPGDREQVTAAVRRSSPKLGNSLEAAWIPMINEDGSYTLFWGCSCNFTCVQTKPQIQEVSYRAFSTVAKFGIME